MGDWWYYNKDEIWGCLTFALVALLAFGFVVGMALLIGHESCKNTSNVMWVAYEWRVFGGCYLEFDGQMVPESVWQHLTFGTMP